MVVGFHYVSQQIFTASQNAQNQNVPRSKTPLFFLYLHNKYILQPFYCVYDAALASTKLWEHGGIYMVKGEENKETQNLRNMVDTCLPC